MRIHLGFIFALTITLNVLLSDPRIDLCPRVTFNCVSGVDLGTFVLTKPRRGTLRYFISIPKDKLDGASEVDYSQSTSLKTSPLKPKILSEWGQIKFQFDISSRTKSGQRTFEIRKAFGFFDCDLDLTGGKNLQDLLLFFDAALNDKPYRCSRADLNADSLINSADMLLLRNCMETPATQLPSRNCSIKFKAEVR